MRSLAHPDYRARLMTLARICDRSLEFKSAERSLPPHDRNAFRMVMILNVEAVVVATQMHMIMTGSGLHIGAYILEVNEIDTRPSPIAFRPVSGEAGYQGEQD